MCLLVKMTPCPVGLYYAVSVCTYDNTPRPSDASWLAHIIQRTVGKPGLMGLPTMATVIEVLSMFPHAFFKVEKHKIEFALDIIKAYPPPLMTHSR